MKFTAVILAAGKGVRMRSQLPKVVHRVAGKPMVVHVTDAARQVGVERIVLVVGHGRQAVEDLFAPGVVEFAVQEEQLGTGHALMQAQEKVGQDETILVLAGDTPLLQAATLQGLIDYHRESGAVATVLSTEVEDPYGYGRIIRDASGSFKAIVEEKDASEADKIIREINSGMYCLQVQDAFSALAGISASNAQGEYYVTDILQILKDEGKKVEIFRMDAREDIYGVNDRVQMAQAEEILRRRKNEALMRNGVSIIDPRSTFIDSEVEIAIDTIIYPGTIIEGRTVIGSGCEIGPGTRITSSIIGNNVLIENSRIKEAQVGDECTIGPFAYLRPQAILHRGVKVGDFVEIKKSTMGEGSKAPHLSYIGDAIVGKGVNIGAGTITCNYDGINKWETVLEDGVFIGSNTNLVAPVKIGTNSVTGAGSTITRDVPANTLAVERAEQKNLKKRSKGAAKK
ncbi:MAG: bifunctional UDP-N-acetylglucosamine diphosphorylase/glucosamine-1-phosphate N-acetyltransferase GlmU [Firmicutes bacterium HGW-Firmicutes-15]|nr:MAG: bifunctional UDP-N-acetylglucosamine diphosphorylase/glucosamine-1-phosphate N-acetyltransferase GlmU [Firmicutes bacterium HGW-Firmicutes-15]